MTMTESCQGSHPPRGAQPSAVVGMGQKLQWMNLSEAEAAGWNDMLARHPMGSVFQHTAFGRVLTSTFPHMQPHYLALVDGQNHPQGGIAVFSVKSWLTGRRLVSLPFAFYGDPIVRSPQEFSLLLGSLSELMHREKASYIEIKALRSSDILAGVDVLTPVYHHKTHFLDVSRGLDTLWSGFHRTAVKQKIRRAEKTGIEVRPATCEQDVRLFHSLLVRSRRRLGLPPQRVSYFDNVWSHLVPLKLATFFIARKAGIPVGGLCCFAFRDTMFLAYIGTDEVLHPDGVDQGLWWHAIQTAIEGGFKVVDLGKTSLQAEGLGTYKQRWGAIELPTPVFYFPRFQGLARLDDERRWSHRLIRFAWRKMPESLARSLSHVAYRHMG